MTEVEKELLLKDIHAKIQYGLKGLHRGGIFRITNLDFCGSYQVESYDAWFNLKTVNFKPYLRPLSSMTDSEKAELGKKYRFSIHGNTIRLNYHSEGYWDTDTETDSSDYLWLYDWMDKHLFDYRGLIELGLALKAPDGIYKTQ